MLGTRWAKWMTLVGVLSIAACGNPSIDESSQPADASRWVPTSISPRAGASLGFRPVQGVLASRGQLAATFTREGVHLDPGTASGITLHTRAVGRPGEMSEARRVAPDLIDGTLLYRHGTWTEWWIDRGTGLEQGWTLEERPVGTGPLQVEVAIEGATARAEDDRVWLTRADGARMGVHSLVVTDTDGRSVPAAFEVSAGRLRITVDDASAAYPLTVDPFYDPPTALRTLEQSSTYGRDTWTGDFDGDGYDDLLVGDPEYMGLGNVQLLRGGPDGLSAVVTQEWIGDDSGGDFGNSVDVGDLNCDGWLDLVVGSPYHSGSNGAVFVFTGGPSGIDTTPDRSIFGSSFFRLGDQIAIGDFDGVEWPQGRCDDLAVTGPGNDGSIQVHLSPGGMIAAAPDRVVIGEDPGGLPGVDIGEAIAAGDVNGDGVDDLLFEQHAPRGAGLFLGVQGSGIEALPSWTVVGQTNFAEKLAIVPSLDGDAIDDIVITDDRQHVGNDDTGEAYVWFGRSGVAPAFPATADVSLAGRRREQHHVGYSVASAGDVDGDGYNDLTLGSYAIPFSYVYVYQGGPNGPLDQEDIELAPPATMSAECDGGTLVTDGDGGSALGQIASGTTVGQSNDVGRLSDVITCSGNSPSPSGASADVAYTWTAPADGQYRFSADANFHHILTVHDGACAETQYECTYGYYYDTDDIGAMVEVDLVAGQQVVVSLDGEWNDESGTFALEVDQIGPISTVPQDGASYWNVSSGDFDGDGIPDLVGVMDSSGTPRRIVVWEGNSDGDDDGYPAAEDCNDDNPNINPGAAELCGNGIDDDCDGVVDPSSGPTWYADVDGDGHGDPLTASTSCPTGNAVSLGDDCNDGDASIAPGAPETCDGVDQDCNGTIDDDPVNAPTFYEDNDGDGFGDGSLPVQACTAPADAVVSGADCNDDDVQVYPGAPERCNGIDDDCDQILDEDGIDPVTWTIDDDNDGYGAIGGDTQQSCEQPNGYALDATDCNDSSWSVNPGRDEVCNGVDDDCDGTVDQNVDSGPQRYADTDGDGYGDPNAGILLCDTPPGFVFNNTDCDDTNPGVNPGQNEVVGDEIDQNCNGVESCYTDFDGDGYRTNDTIQSADTLCDGPQEAAANTPSGDCNDATAAINPGAVEVCNGQDDDCNGQTDDGTAGATAYQDLDGDGFGDPNVTMAACPPPPGYVANGTDCDDTNEDRNPAAGETCNGIDDDCDGIVDSDATNPPTWYPDSDGDGFGGPTPLQSCNPGAGFVQTSTDCNDQSATVFPGATEIVGNEVDEDCNGSELCFIDFDLDGFRTDDVASSTDTTCDGDGLARVGVPAGDCVDSNPNVNPGGIEICNGIDDDCSGAIDDGTLADVYLDADGDGFGDPSMPQPSCDGGPDYVADDGDCNDADPSVNPAATEVCNGRDDDCDGANDTDAVDQQPYFIDADGDGFGTGNGLPACTEPLGFVPLQGDCDDSSGAISPVASELVGDGLDSNCDGLEQCYLDADADGYRVDDVVLSASLTCNEPGLATATVPPGDCDDALPGVNPAGVELCNGLDDNCDDMIDNGANTTWEDEDGDGFGNPMVPVQQCPVQEGYAGNASDCDDEDPLVNPDAVEQCDGIDNNCNGAVDLDSTAVLPWYADADGDGFGGSVVVETCIAPSGFTEITGDCNDQEPSAYPGATEVLADGVDNDCNGTERCLLDLDDDGFHTGVAVETEELDCAGSGFALATEPGGDCDDTNADVRPDQPEIDGNGIDDNCNGFIDETDAQVDVDGDGYCAGGLCIDGSFAGDCDETDPTTNPGSCEVIDGIDNDCSGVVDDPGAGDAGCQDLDGDGFTVEDGDCNDNDIDVNPLSEEACNGFDDDCNGYVPPDELDVDGDGLPICGGDCDDTNADVRAGLSEMCGDGLDNDCDGTIDIDADNDGDGVTTCQGDCDDGNPEILPSASEQQNDLDDDCDGRVDEGFDADSDGYERCADGDAPEDCDCDDSRSDVNPGVPENCSDGIDNNCDGSVDDIEIDLDGDGVAACDGDCNDYDATINPFEPENCDGIDNDCDGFVDEVFDIDADGVLVCRGDCDDYANTVFPQATEACDGIDNDCDELIDDEFTDDDGDGLTECQGDCDDDDPDRSPDLVEECGDGFDNNCDGLDDWDDPTCDASALPPRWYCATGPSGMGAPAMLALLLHVWRRRRTPSRERTGGVA